MKKKISSHALAAKNIRRELKSAFPSVKFSVRSSSFSMGDSVDVDYEDGPERNLVESIVNKYEKGHFNGMEDTYEYYPNKNIEAMGSTKYAMVSRSWSCEAQMICEGLIQDNCNLENSRESYSEMAWRFFAKTNLINAVAIGCDFDEDKFKVCEVVK
jgi:hypothetical protein